MVREAVCSGCINFTIHSLSHRQAGRQAICISSAEACRRDRVVARGSSHLPPAAEISTKIPHCASPTRHSECVRSKACRWRRMHIVHAYWLEISEKRIACPGKPLQGLRTERGFAYESRAFSRKKLCMWSVKTAGSLPDAINYTSFTWTFFFNLLNLLWHFTFLSNALCETNSFERLFHFLKIRIHICSL